MHPAQWMSRGGGQADPAKAVPATLVRIQFLPVDESALLQERGNHTRHYCVLSPAAYTTSTLLHIKARRVSLLILLNCKVLHIL